jgi:hypothetical protein
MWSKSGWREHAVWLAALVVLFGQSQCGGGNGGAPISPAQQSGVGRECSSNANCNPGQICLNFKGGYCGLRDCLRDADCPLGSACVAHTDGVNYCFLICTDKSQCNYTRPQFEANCSSTITFVEPPGKGKACIPPS